MNFYCQAGYKNSTDRVYVFFSPRNPTTGELISGWNSGGGVYVDVLSIKWNVSLFYDLIIHDQAMETISISAAPYLSNTMYTTSFTKSQFVDPTSGAVYEGPVLLVFKNEMSARRRVGSMAFSI